MFFFDLVIFYVAFCSVCLNASRMSFCLNIFIFGLTLSISLIVFVDVLDVLTDLCHQYLTCVGKPWIPWMEFMQSMDSIESMDSTDSMDSFNPWKLWNPWIPWNRLNPWIP